MKNIKFFNTLIAFVLIVSLFGSFLTVHADDENLEDDVTVNTEEVIEESNDENTELYDGILGEANLVLISNGTELEVGMDAQYQLYLTLDGRHETYKNIEMSVELPKEIDGPNISFNQNLSELTVMGVVPTYNEALKVLTYYFEELPGGFESSIQFKLETKNGSALNHVTLLTRASISGDDITEKVVESNVMLVANQNASVSNKLKGIMKDGELQSRTSLKYKDEAVFAVGASINKYGSGTLAPKPGSKIVLTYTFEEGIEYVSDSSGITPTNDGLTYTWEFESNHNEDEEYFFNTNFDIISKVEGDLSVFSTISNVANVNVVFVDDSTTDYTVKATAMISPNFDYELEGAYDGGAYSSIFSGPSDGLGNVGWINNDDVGVTEGAMLGWNFYLTSMYATSPNHGMNSYNVFFHPDENLNIRNMYSGSFYYRPSSAFADAGLQPIEEPVYYSLSIKYTDSNEWEREIESIVPETYYSAADLGIDSSRTVETMWFHFHNNSNHIFWDDVGYGNVQDSSVFDLPAGLTTTNLRIWTTIDEDYIGSIESHAGIGFSGWNSRKDANRVDFQSKYVPEELKVSTWTSFPDAMESRLAPKTAQVVTPPTGINQYVKSNVFFTKANKNLIDSGDNGIQVEVTNDTASTKSLVGPFETYVLVDEGVILKDLESVVGADVTLVTDNFKDTNKTLLKVMFKTKRLSYGTKTSVIIPVVITDHAPYNLSLEVIGYLDYDFAVSDVSNTDGSFTIKEVEKFDFNNNGQEDDVYVTKNKYTYTKAYEYYATHTASNDQVNYYQNINVRDGRTTDLKLGINNTLNNPITSFNLIGVLPSVDDSYVLSDELRNSKFSMRLTGAIVLPEDYKEHFEVLYSESKEPKINGVIDRNMSPRLKPLDTLELVDDQAWLLESEVRDFSQIKSYKIVMKDYVSPIRDSQFEFRAPVMIQDHNLNGKENIEDRLAYSTYAVGINDASVFETQSINFLYEVPSEYKIVAKDVTMKLSDVRSMYKDKVLEEYVKNKALPIVFKDDIELPNINVLMELLNIPKQFEVGEYPLQFTYVYDENTDSKVTVSSKLIVVDDDQDIKEPEKEKPESETPSTGINSSILTQSLIIAGSSLVLFSLVKRKKTKKY